MPQDDDGISRKDFDPDRESAPDRDSAESPQKPPEELPLCIGCLEPIDPLDYYCPKCGQAANQLTPYIPFVNIRYNYSIYGRLWHNFWYTKTSLLMKIISITLILLFVPVMLIGLPFVLWDKCFYRKQQNQAPSHKEQNSNESM